MRINLELSRIVKISIKTDFFKKIITLLMNSEKPATAHAVQQTLRSELMNGAALCCDAPKGFGFSNKLLKKF